LTGSIQGVIKSEEQRKSRMDAGQWLFCEMDNLRDQYETMKGEAPEVWLMGKSEYALLCHTLKKEFGIAANPNERLKYNEVPVMIKATGGVEIGMDFKTATQFTSNKFCFQQSSCIPT